MTSPSEAKQEILADPEALARQVADWLLAAATAKDGVFAVALAGGSTSQRLHELLAGPPYRDRFASYLTTSSHHSITILTVAAIPGLSKRSGLGALMTTS
jgi:hypothetical protein